MDEVGSARDRGSSMVCRDSAAHHGHAHDERGGQAAEPLGRAPPRACERRALTFAHRCRDRAEPIDDHGAGDRAARSRRDPRGGDGADGSCSCRSADPSASRPTTRWSRSASASSPTPSPSPSWGWAALCTPVYGTTCRVRRARAASCRSPAPSSTACAPTSDRHYRLVGGRGLAVPGLVDEAGTVVVAPPLGWRREAIATRLERALGVR